jgi:cell division protein FtsI/penicillin-binding protein 2
MVNTPPKRRLWLFFTALLVAFTAAGFRLVDLQVLRHDELLPRARANTQRTYFRPAPRGEIRDVRGNLLAASKLVKNVCADPTLICNTNIGNRQEEVAAVLAPILGKSPAQIVQQLQLRYFTNANGKITSDRYVVLKQKIKVEEWEMIQRAMTNATLGIDFATLPKRDRPYYKLLRERAIFSQDDQLREYPNKTLASHILGFVGEVERDTLKEAPREMVGKEGCEFSLNKVLTGIPGWVMTETDDKKQEIPVWRVQDVAPKPGLNAVLTIDLRVQYIVETELAAAVAKHHPISASAIVVRPATGEILAMATWPNFDPNRAGEFTPDTRRNRVICDTSEPGSTFKIVVVTGALEDKDVSLHENIFCENGQFYFAGHILHDHERYGNLTVEQIITKSSNIGSAKIGMKMGAESLYKYIRGFGFGDYTGIALPGEVRGILKPVERWEKISISRIPMGHEVAATPIQMVMAMSAIANQGRLMKPQILNRFEDSEGTVRMRFEPQEVRRICSEETARQMVTALKTVVSTNGTGRKVRMENYTVAGKTGTAKKNNGKVYLDGKYFSSFIGFLPADKPELCISVVLDEPHEGTYGGDTAGPIFKNIAERAVQHLSIPPDIAPAEGPMATSPRVGRAQTASRTNAN